MDKTISQLEDELDTKLCYFRDLYKCGIISESDYNRHVEETTNYYNKLIDDIVNNYYN